MDTHAIIMAGGEGKRMQSSIPKVLHNVAGEPMILRILKKVQQLNVVKIYIVCGKALDQIQTAVEQYFEGDNNVVFVHQPVAKGTGDAIRQCLPFLPNKEVNVLILNGDTPLIDVSLDMFVTSPVPALMVTELDNPYGNGRILTDVGGKFKRIVEEKDATLVEKTINLVNCGAYYISCRDLQSYIPLLSCNNAQKEYYLTDICEFIKDNLHLVQIPKYIQYELINVNSPLDLANAERQVIQKRLNTMGMIIRNLEQDDFNKGYLDLLCELSNTITNKSKQFFDNVYTKVQHNDRHYIFVIEDVKQHKIVASVTLLVEPKFIHDGKNVGHVEDVVVAATHRTNKLGTTLIEYVNTFMTELKCYKYILDCHEGLQRFYGKSGYDRRNIQMAMYQ